MAGTAVDASTSALDEKNFMGESSGYNVVTGVHNVLWNVRKVNFAAFCRKGVIAL
jgi:hypothetical protein